MVAGMKLYLRGGQLEKQPEILYYYNIYGIIAS